MAEQQQQQNPLKVSYIGLGIMGANIARNIIQKGNFANPVLVWNRTASKATPLIALGAMLATSPKNAAEQSDIIFTNLSDTPDVQDVILRSGDGILEGCTEGAIIVDNSTIKPKVAQFIAEQCWATKKVYFVDCPVSGAEPAAIAGTCTAMLGGEESAIETITPVLKCFCKAVTHIGPSGAGQIAKCANQIMVAAQMTAEAELLVYSKKSGVDPMKVVEALRHGGAACFTLDHKPQRIMAGNRAPGFKIDHQLKDLKIVMESAADNNVALPVTSLNLNLYQSSVAQGEGDLDNSAVLGVIERMNNTQVGKNYRQETK
jgi:2-hydroxy-3-oxopropionate reductase